MYFKAATMAVQAQQSTDKIINSSSSKAPRDSAPTIGDRAFKGVGDLIKLLPSGTVFLFQFLSPLLTNTGHCSTVNKYLTGVLLFVCGFSCCFSSFTDSYVEDDGKIYYGVVTKNGLWLFSDPKAGTRDLSKYKLRMADFVHASLALVVFAVVALLDDSTVSCFYPSLVSKEKTLVMVLPPVVGGVASFVFMLFPNNRHGIGYPPSGTTTKDS